MVWFEHILLQSCTIRLSASSKKLNCPLHRYNYCPLPIMYDSSPRMFINQVGLKIGRESPTSKKVFINQKEHADKSLQKDLKVYRKIWYLVVMKLN